LSTSVPTTSELAAALARIGAVQFGTFTLKSGATSPVYVDLRLLVSDPGVLALAARAYAGVLSGLKFDRIAAIPYAGLPIGTAVSLELGVPLIYPRKETKAYGLKRPIEGAFRAGETVVVLDDLISDGGSKLEAIAPLTEAGLQVHDVVVLLDRGGGGRETLAAAGLKLHAVTSLLDVVGALEAARGVSADQAKAVREYVATAS
jgi:uridine monophosphate synthetase